jgi:hypothetical protein
MDVRSSAPTRSRSRCGCGTRASATLYVAGDVALSDSSRAVVGKGEFGSGVVLPGGIRTFTWIARATFRPWTLHRHRDARHRRARADGGRSHVHMADAGFRAAAARDRSVALAALALLLAAPPAFAAGAAEPQPSSALVAAATSAGAPLVPPRPPRRAVTTRALRRHARVRRSRDALGLHSAARAQSALSGRRCSPPLRSDRHRGPAERDRSPARAARAARDRGIHPLLPSGSSSRASNAAITTRTS